MPAPLLAAAAIAAQPLAAQGRGAARNDGAPGAGLRRAQRAHGEIGRPEVLQHLGQGGAHGAVASGLRRLRGPRSGSLRQGWQLRQQRQRSCACAVAGGGHAQVASGGAQLAVAEPLADAVQVDPGLQQMRRKALAPMPMSA